MSESFENATFPPAGWVNLQGGTGNMWTRTNELASNGSFSVRYAASPANAANAWLISPGITMIGGITYTITYDQWVWDLLLTENLRVTIGTSQTIAGQTTVLQNLPGLINIVATPRTITYTPTLSGVYYIGWNCYSPANQGRIYIDNISVVQPVLSTPVTTLSNVAAVSTQSTSFAHRIGSSQRPKFTFSTNIGFNAAQIEVNTRADFTGTSYVTSFSNPSYWNPGVLIDFRTTQSLVGNRTYFVRARTSLNGGTTWGAWTTALWPYSYYTGLPYTEEGWYYTTGEQFQTGFVQEPLYNFSVAPTTTLPDDAVLTMAQGTFSYNAQTTDGVRENGVWYPGLNYMGIGWQNTCNGNGAIFNGFPFTVNIPGAAVISSANFSVVSTTDCLCENQNVNLQLIADAHSADNAPALTLANVADLTGRTTANQTFQYSSAWANDTRYTLTSATNILQEIINRPGWAAGNNFNLLLRWNTAFTAPATSNRCIRQANNGTTTAPRLDGTFTNFKNTVYFPAVNRTWYGPAATAWRELKIADNTVCTSCYIEYRIHDASTNAVVAGPFVRVAGQNGIQSFNISGVTAANIFVSTTMFRTNVSPSIANIWLTVNTPSPLPVELTAFSASCEDDAVKIRWTTASEINAARFEVQRSSDLVDWTNVGDVAAQGNSTVKNDYELIDFSATREIFYYRLQQVDFNGQTELSDPVSVACDPKGSGLSVFPNPSRGEFTVEVRSDKIVQGAVLEITDLNGRIVLQRSVVIQPGTTHFPIKGQVLERGVYVLSLDREGQLETVRIFIE